MQTGALLEFFRLWADRRRQIVGLLSQQEYSVEELALTPATVSHHLQRLVKAGLVQAKADQHYTSTRASSRPCAPCPRKS